MYWILLVPFVVLLMALEVLKDENPNLRNILRRVVTSVILLLCFDWTIGAIGTVGDAVTAKINGLEKLSEVLGNLGPNYSGKDNWFSLRETFLYALSILSYLVAYIGFFAATALTHFVWTVLYVVSPLMILMYVSPHTASVTFSLYKGLVQVIVWKILWSILGVLLLKLAIQPEITGMEDYLMSVVVNLCIGFSMLFIPLATRSLISDGLNSAANSLAAVPAFAAAGAIKVAAVKYGGKLKGAAAFAAKPATNAVAGRVEMMRDRLRPGFDRAKAAYGSFGLPEEIRKKHEFKGRKEK